MSAVTLDQQIAAARREVFVRERTYPNWVSSGYMTKERADGDLASMRAIVETLESLRAAAVDVFPPQP